MKQGKRGYYLVAGPRACVIFLLLFSAPVSPENASSGVWTAADMLSLDGGVSVFRYADFGLGAYPWRISLPGAITRIRVDGVPLYGFSPFGPDLDLVPAVYVDSLVYEPPDVISLRTSSHESDEPETVTDFFQGANQQFRFDGTFARKLSAQSSLFIGGSSSGIHSSRETEAAEFRNYMVKYRRSIENGGELFLSARALRDRDGLRDIERAVRMGNRETDMVTLTVGVTDLPLTGRTTVTPVVYRQSGISRFRRYGVRKSLDDDGFGFSCNTVSRFDSGVLSLSVSSDIRSIDSRIHEKSWQRDDSRLFLSWKKQGTRQTYSIYGGILYSSHFGTGSSSGGEATVRISPSITLSLRGARTDEIPDTGMEVYPSLAFSDSALVPHVCMYRFREIESGIQGYHETLSWGVFGFHSGGRLPVFVPETAMISTDGTETFSGIRLFMALDRDDRYHVTVRAHYGNPDDTHRFNPYPKFECVSRAGVIRMFFRDKLTSSYYGSLRVSGWDGPMTPDKTAMFLDAGVSFTVATLSLFINVQNITGEDVSWFDTYGWQGINTVWGLRWKIKD